MNKFKALTLLIVILCTSQLANSKRIQFLKQKCFICTKGNKTSTINLRYTSETKYLGEIVVTEADVEDAQTMGFTGTDDKGRISKVFNNEAPEFVKGQLYSKQAWKLVKEKGADVLYVKYFSKGSKIKYYTYKYTACPQEQ